MMTPNYYFIFSKVNIKRLFSENIIKDKDKKMNFYQSVKTIFRKYSQKIRFGGNFIFSSQGYDKNYSFFKSRLSMSWGRLLIEC